MPSKGKGNKAAKALKANKLKSAPEIRPTTNKKSNAKTRKAGKANKVPIMFIAGDFVGTDVGLSPIFVALVDDQGNVPLSSYVIPYGTVIDWKTEITSLSCFEDLRDCNPIEMENLYEYLGYLVLQETVLVGYGVDLIVEALRLRLGVDFSAAVDIATWFGLQLSSPSLVQYFTLSHVVKEVLNEDLKDIYSGQHDPLADARYIRLIYEKFVKTSYDNPALQKIRRSLYQSLPVEKRIPDPSLMIAVEQIPVGFGNEELEKIIPYQVRQCVERILPIEWVTDVTIPSFPDPTSMERMPVEETLAKINYDGYCCGEMYPFTDDPTTYLQDEEEDSSSADATKVPVTTGVVTIIGEGTSAESLRKRQISVATSDAETMAVSFDSMSDVSPVTPVTPESSTSCVTPPSGTVPVISEVTPKSPSNNEVATTVSVILGNLTISGTSWADDDPAAEEGDPITHQQLNVSYNSEEVKDIQTYNYADCHSEEVQPSELYWNCVPEEAEYQAENGYLFQDSDVLQPTFHSGHSYIYCQTMQDLRKIILRLHSNPDDWDWQVRKEGSHYVNKNTGVMLKEVDNPANMLYVHSVPDDWTDLELKKYLIPDEMIKHVKEVKQTQYRRNKLGVLLGKTHIQFHEDWCVWQMLQILHNRHQVEGSQTDWNFTTLENGGVVFTYTPTNVVVEPVCTITWQQLMML